MDEDLDAPQQEHKPVTLAEMFLWYELKTQLAKVKAEEMALRRRIFADKFMAPREGTNSVDLEGGYVLKGTRTIDRKVDIGAARVMSEKDGLFQQHGIVADDLIKWTPELEMRAYRALLPEKRLVFEQCLIIKDGSPSLEIVLPAAAKKGK